MGSLCDAKEGIYQRLSCKFLQKETGLLGFLQSIVRQCWKVPTVRSELVQKAAVPHLVKGLVEVNEHCKCLLVLIKSLQPFVGAVTSCFKGSVERSLLP